MGFFMHLRGLPPIVIAAMTLVLSQPVQAAGTLTRTFVSSAGSDHNPCTTAQPCATFAAAYNAVEANGIVAALDPGKYGPLTITAPVTINGNGWAAITGAAAGNGITINAGSGDVILSGLEIDGAGAAFDGIVFNSGTSLTISNCVVKDVVVNSNDNSGTSGAGIWIAPTSGTLSITIVNTVVSNNASEGILYYPLSGNATAEGAIDHVVITNNAFGFTVNSSLTSGGSAAFTISNSVVSNNSGDGIYINGATTTIDNDQISNNAYGVIAYLGTVILGRSTITNNSSYGVNNGGTVYTYQDNHIEANGNSNAVQGTPLTPVAAQ